MKKLIVLVVFVLFPIFGFSQIHKDLDFISPFNENLAAIKKGDQWAFINKKGDVVIDFRDDLVPTKFDIATYPIFKNGRCLMLVKKDGISYYGYIDTTGQIAVAPKFLNAKNFNNYFALALKLKEEEVGRNDVLDKRVVYYRYFEVLIDTSGTAQHYLTKKGVNVVLDKKQLQIPPKILSKRISDNLFAIKSKNGKWEVFKIN